MLSAVSTRFSFLSAGPEFTIDLPETFDSVPELSSPISNGQGGRSFVFAPKRLDEGLDGDRNLLVEHVADRDGRTVEVFRRRTEPPLWRLRWQLAEGALYTHLREEDGIKMAAVTASAVSVAERSGRPPAIIVFPPLEFGASRWPNYQEEVLFTQATADGPSIALERPGALDSSSAFVADRTTSGGLAVIRLGLGEGIDASVSMGEDMEATERVATMLRASLAAS